MKAIDLEDLYMKLSGRLLLTTAYTSFPYIVDIIKACRLKPYSIFEGTFRPGTLLENHWVDEFGHSLKLEKDNTYISFYDTNISDYTKISSDLFCCNDIKQVVNISKVVLNVECNLLDTDFQFASFYGEDQYLRTFVYTNDWNITSPLIMGLDILQEYFKNIDKNRIIEIDVRRLSASMYNVKKFTVYPIRKDFNAKR